MKNKEKRKIWNEQMIDNQKIADIDEFSGILNSSFNGSPASNRDFCVFYTYSETDEEYLDAQTSIEDERCPARKGFVRATCFYSGTMLQKVNDNQTKMIYVGQVDLGGWVPSFVGNIVNINQPLCIARLRKFCKDQEKEEQNKAKEGETAPAAAPAADAAASSSSSSTSEQPSSTTTTETTSSEAPAATDAPSTTDAPTATDSTTATDAPASEQAPAATEEHKAEEAPKE